MIRRQLLRYAILCGLLGGSAALGAAPAIGSVALYDDGSALKLLSVHKHRRVWQDHRLRRLTYLDNPVMPPVERVGPDGHLQYRERLQGATPAKLRLRRPGQKVEFETQRLDGRGNGAVRHYECTYLGTRQARVLGRRERLQRFSCQRFTLHKKLWTRRIRESRTFSYSPRLGLVVDLVRETPRSRRERHLIALFPPGRYRYERVRQALAAARKGGVQ